MLEWLFRKLQLLESPARCPTPPPTAEGKVVSDEDDSDEGFENYLQEILERLYDDEAEKNESIWRSTPFFVTAFGLVVAALGFLATKAPTPEASAWPIIIYALLIIVSGLAAIAFWWLFEMLRERTYGYVLNGRELRAHALSLKEFHEQTGAGKAATKLALSEFRTYVIDQLAETATVSRASNRKRARARSLAVFFLMLSTALAFFTIGLIFVGDKVQAITTQGTADDGSGTNTQAAPTEPPTPPAAEPAPAGIRPRGRESTVSDTTPQGLKSNSLQTTTQEERSRDR